MYLNEQLMAVFSICNNNYSINELKAIGQGASPTHWGSASIQFIASSYTH